MLGSGRLSLLRTERQTLSRMVNESGWSSDIVMTGVGDWNFIEVGGGHATQQFTLLFCAFFFFFFFFFSFVGSLRF